MATGGVIDVVNVSDNVITASSKFVSQLGQIGLWLQALGVIVVLWLVFEIIALIVNRKRMKEIYTIKDDMKRIEDKIDDIRKQIRAR